MRRSASVALIATGLILGSCSKTQDTAPETRLFGAAPVIQNATLVQNNGVGVATCDVTDIIKGILCENGYPVSTFQFPAPIEIIVHYTEAEISVQTTDPDTKAGGQNDILLVAASYQSCAACNPPVESSLVVLDDGAGGNGSTTNQFSYQQKANIKEGCNPDPNLCADPQGVACGTAQYGLNSNDQVQNDNTWTRGFALMAGSGDTHLTYPAGISVDGTNQVLAGDCVAKVKHQYPVIAVVNVGTPVNFKIEVVDRAGNLTAWPQPLGVTFDQTLFECRGDDCGCCLMLSNDPGSQCKGRPGLVSPSTPNGWCIDNLGS